MSVDGLSRGQFFARALFAIVATAIVAGSAFLIVRYLVG